MSITSNILVAGEFITAQCNGCLRYMVDPFVVLFGLFLLSMGFLYLLAILYDKYFSLRKRREKDRAMMETLGDEEVNYNNPYFTRLTEKSSVGDNLPTRYCEECGAGLNPADQFCAICGSKAVLFDDNN